MLMYQGIKWLPDYLSDLIIIQANQRRWRNRFFNFSFWWFSFHYVFFWWSCREVEHAFMFWKLSTTHKAIFVHLCQHVAVILWVEGWEREREEDSTEGLLQNYTLTFSLTQLSIFFSSCCSFISSINRQHNWAPIACLFIQLTGEKKHLSLSA